MRPAGAGALGRDLIELALDLADEPLVLCQPEHEVDVVGFAPPHQVLARESRVGAQHNARRRPAGADAGDHARHLLDRAVRRVQARTPQLGDQQMAATEHVERQVAVAVVVTVEEPLASATPTQTQ